MFHREPDLVNATFFDVLRLLAEVALSVLNRTVQLRLYERVAGLEAAHLISACSELEAQPFAYGKNSQSQALLT
jgi:hypothetical protein